MQRPRSLGAFLAIESAFGETLAPPPGQSLRNTAALHDLQLQYSPASAQAAHAGAGAGQQSQQSQQSQPQQQGSFYDGGPQQHLPQQQGAAAGQGAQQQGAPPPVPLPVSHLLRSASPGPGPRAPSAASDRAASSNAYYSAAKSSDVPWSKLLRRRWFALRNAAAARPAAAAAAGLLVSLLLLLLAVLPLRGPQAAGAAAGSGYIVFFDAGSTGTRAHVFRYELPGGRHAQPSGGGGGGGHGGAHVYAKIHLPEPKLKVEPGLSAYADDPAGAAASLRPLLEFARSHVPPAARAATPVRLMATAGLRLVPGGAAAAVLAACAREIAGSGFAFRPEWAEVISGRAEGLFAWAAANYAAGALEDAAAQAAVARKSPRDWSKFSGLLELGGASAQVTYLLVDRERGREAVADAESGGNGSAARAAGGAGQWQGQQRGGGGGGGGEDEADEEAEEELSPREDFEAEAFGGARQQRLRRRREAWRDKRKKAHLQLQLPGVTKQLFTHSYLGYGFDVLESRLAAIAKRAAAEDAAAAAPGKRGAAAGGGDAAPDPCLPKGYFASDGRAGTGDWHACRRRVADAMDPGGCSRRAPAAADGGAGPGGSPGGGGGGGKTAAGSGGGAGGDASTNAAAGGGGGCPEFPESLPPLPPALVATENFYYTATALALPPRADLRALEAAASEFCARPWPDTLAAWRAAGDALVGEEHAAGNARDTSSSKDNDDARGAAAAARAAREHHLSQERFLWRYCFGSALVWTLLHDVLAVPPGQPLVFANSVAARDGNEVGLDWALGAAVCTLMGCTQEGGGGGGEPPWGAGADEGGGARRFLFVTLLAAAAALVAAAAARRRARAAGAQAAAAAAAAAALVPGWLRVVIGSGGGAGSSGGGGGGGGKSSPVGGRPRSPAKGMRSRTPSVNGMRSASTPSGSRRQVALAIPPGTGG